MKFSAITKDNVEGFKALLLPEAAAAIRKGEDVGAIGLLDEEGEIPAAVAAVAGIARDDVFQIFSLMVEKKYRKKGYGRQLVQAVEAQAKNFGLPLVAEYPSATEGQEMLEEFFLHLGFREGDMEYPMVRFPLSALKDTGAKGEGTSAKLLSFSGIPEEILRQADERAKKELLPMPQGGLLSAQVNRECSIGAELKGELAAYVTVEELSDQEILLSSLWCQYPITEADPLLFEAFRKIRENYPKDTTVYVFVGSDYVGDFLGANLKDPEIVSKRFVK